MKTFKQFAANHESIEAVHFPKHFVREDVKRSSPEKSRAEPRNAKRHQDMISVIDSIRFDLASLYIWIDGRMKRLVTNCTGSPSLVPSEDRHKRRPMARSET